MLLRPKAKQEFCIVIPNLQRGLKIQFKSYYFLFSQKIWIKMTVSVAPSFPIADQSDPEGLRQYFVQKIEELNLIVAEKQQNLRRLQAQRNELNAKVRMLREELQLLVFRLFFPLMILIYLIIGNILPSGIEDNLFADF